jgi:predicted dehydrogenase
MNDSRSRRDFLRTSAAAGLGFSALGFPHVRAAATKGKLRVLSIGVIGTIGLTDRRQVAKHTDVEITGLCDVDSNYLSQAALEHPTAFTCRDYREAFSKHADKFDAVIVATPDHTHGPILLTAMAHDKHVYGQKPLVHQLEELVMVERAIKAKPDLVTQLGNQRMAHPGRRAAVEILRHGMLGKAVEAFVWSDAPGDNEYFNFHHVLKEAKVPDHLDWDLWLGPCGKMSYHELLAPAKFRSWWDFGTNGLGDWGCHLLDVIIFSYDELLSPVSVKTDCADAAGEIFHVNPCRSTITYQVGSNQFSNKTFPIYYYDSNQHPLPEQLSFIGGIKDGNITVVVCEGGALLLEADGGLKIWRDGKMEPGLRMPGLPAKFEPINHWHAWVDNCLGRNTELRTPFKDAVRITEATLLAVKATRFPGQALEWDKSTLTFPNHAEASRTLVRRQYRDGFGPPKFA